MLQADFGDGGSYAHHLYRAAFSGKPAPVCKSACGIGAPSQVAEAPLEALDGELKSWLFGYEQVRSVALEEDMLNAVRRIQKRGPWVHRLEATIESHMNLAARLREQTGIPGLSSEQVLLCRDKFIMKRFLRSKGVPGAKC